jgi:hypothetical protein
MRSMGLRLTVAAGVLALVFAAVAVAGGPRGKPIGITWGGVHFSDSASLAGWLGKRGVRYRDWEQRHPRAQYLLTHPAASTPKPKAQNHRPPGAVGAARTAAENGSSTTPTLIALHALGGLLVFAAGGQRIANLTRWPVLTPEQLASARFGAAAVAAMALIGLVFARTL